MSIRQFHTSRRHYVVFKKCIEKGLDKEQNFEQNVLIYFKASWLFIFFNSMCILYFTIGLKIAQILNKVTSWLSNKVNQGNEKHEIFCLQCYFCLPAEGAGNKFGLTLFADHVSNITLVDWFSPVTCKIKWHSYWLFRFGMYVFLGFISSEDMMTF